MLRANQQLRVDDFVADGVPDQAGRRMDIQLAVDGRPMCRLDAEIENGCGLFIAVAHSYQLQQGALACGQTLQLQNALR